MSRFFGLIMFALMLVGLTTQVQARQRVAAVDPGRLLHISGPITDRSMQPVQSALVRMAGESKEPITIVLDSPGGSVIAGTSFLNQMYLAQSQGITINCYVLDMAASMAFQILTQCDSRKALHTSYLLWHGVRVGVMMAIITEEAARSLLIDLRRFNVMIYDQLNAALPMKRSEIRKHFLAETLWPGKQLAAAAPGFLVTERAFPEIAKHIDSAVRTQSAGLFGVMDIVYIWDRFLPKPQTGVTSK
jgi:ATP-dependent protease ClpP protease subunit